MNRELTGSAMHGFTLTELAVVMTIVAILATIAIPTFQYVTNGNRASGELNGLLGDMQFARSEAVKEGQYVTVCSSTNGTSCAGAGATSWNTGWIVFADYNANQVLDGPDVLLRKGNGFISTDTLTANNGFYAVTFNREGFGSTGSVNPVTLTLHAATPSSASTRCLTVSVVGMLATVPYTVGSCQ
jgi:type IV fimbrial biogenesis protein FimT